MWIVFITIIVISLILVIYLYFRKRPFIALFDVKSLDKVKEKKVKQQIVRARAERLIQAKTAKGLDLFKKIAGRAVSFFRPWYYWAVQEVEVPVVLNKEITEKNLENDLLQIIFEDPQNIKAYLDLAYIYLNDEKVEDVIQLLAHIKRIAKKYPHLISNYFEDLASFNAEIKSLENKLSLD